MKNPEVIALLLEGLLKEMKSRQYMNNVSVDDIEEVMQPQIDAFRSLV